MKVNRSIYSNSEFIVFLGLLGLGGFFSIASPVFLTRFNLMNILLQSSTQGIIAIGMTFVILTQGIDLSVGSLVALSGVVMAIMLHLDIPVYLVLDNRVRASACSGPGHHQNQNGTVYRHSSGYGYGQRADHGFQPRQDDLFFP